ncbi:protein-glutamate O-methyltransferase CheR [Candidatus Aerophobetes bacterium]|nr:protein-glutamate O-methyltransferase CheR [Candidatus Aerophobetes bacterium]
MNINEKETSFEADYEFLKKRLLKKSGINLDAYKPRQMRRRIKELSKKMGFSTLREYWRFLEKNPADYRKFLDYITINFSEFFRDPDQFKELEKRIIPGLLRKTSNLRIWSAACAGGEEPYSVAIILEEKCPQVKVRILATDIDEAALKKAELGIYNEIHLRNVSPQRLRRFFVQCEGKFKIKENIRKRVKFKKMNLLKDEFPREFFWLILCRNMIIYLEEDAKDTLIRKLHGALKKGGVLFTGGTEKILNPEEFGFKVIGDCFYQKI